LGLGLAIVRHLVELHGGSVSATSDGIGQGATFSVELPIRALHSEPAETSGDGNAHAAEPAETLTLLLGVKILVIDDDEDSRLLLQTALERVGAWVRSADSAASAFKFLEQQRVDVLISDIGMPDEDGFSLMRRLRELPMHQRLQAVALTAYARAEDVTHALDAGFQRHVAKPANIAELARTVAELVEQAGLRGV
jgi:CheY-like chemotaxis protein